MAIINAPSMADRVYQGDEGNCSVAEAQIVFGANGIPAAANGDVINLLTLPVGMRIHGISIVSEALGANVQIKSGSKVLLNAAATTTAGQSFTPIVPYSTLVSDEVVTATAAGAIATGRLVVLLHYVAVGY